MDTDFWEKWTIPPFQYGINDIHDVRNEDHQFPNTLNNINRPKDSWSDDQFLNHGFEWGPSVYFSIVVIVMFTLVFIFVEVQRRKIVSQLNNGYYFVEQFVTLKQKRLIPVAPDNVDTSDPACPRIINPSLLEQYTCTCCA